MSSHTPPYEQPASPLPDEAPPRISLRGALWPILLSLVVLFVLGLFTFDPGAFGDMWRALNPKMIGAAILMVAARVLFGGWRLHHVSHHRLSFIAATRGQLAWDFASNMTPSLVGGAPLAAFFIARDSKGRNNGEASMGEVTAWMLFVMLLDQFWFAMTVPAVLVAATMMEVIPASFGTVGFWSSVIYFVAFMVWTVVFAYATLFRPELIQRIADGICRIRWLRRFRGKVAGEMEHYRERARILRSQPFLFYFKGFLLSLGTWLARYFLLVFIVWSVVPHLDVTLTFFRTAALTLGSLILPTPGGAGGIEGFFALLMGPLMAKGMLVPTLLLWRILAYYIFLGFGVFLTTHTVHMTIQRRKWKRRNGHNTRADMNLHDVEHHAH